MSDTIFLKFGELESDTDFSCREYIHVGVAPPSLTAKVSERSMAQPASTLLWLAHLFPTPYHDASKVFAGRYPSETFSRDPEPFQPAIICGSGVSEGYLPAKTGQGKTQ